MSRFEMNQIKGVIPAMMTFFDKEENVDTECTRRMAVSYTHLDVYKRQIQQMACWLKATRFLRMTSRLSLF